MLASCARLPAADELHDLQPGTVLKQRGGPILRLDDTAIQFHRHAGRIEIEPLQELPNGLPAGHAAALAVDPDPDLRAG